MSERRNEEKQPARGVFFMLVGPSGAGKTTLLRRWLADAPDLRRVLSVTVRPPRPGEVDGRDYHFWREEDFRAAVERGEFIEYAEVHGNLYGTLRGALEAELDAGHDVVKDIDVQGAAQVRRLLPYPDSVAVFVLPPTKEEMERRLRGRGTEDEAALACRLSGAVGELARIGECEYVVWNEAVEGATAELRAVRAAEHCRRERREKELAGRGYPSAAGAL